MPSTSSSRTGSRIRARRLDLGMRQADLAQTAGISPSYLNLIEHDKRRIAGRLLSEIAVALQIEPVLLTEGAERAVLDAMQRAAGDWEAGRAELDRAEDLAARYPGWAGLIAAQAARIASLEAKVQVLTDRMTYDPDLATALHGMISAVTAIRSTAAILTSDEKLDAVWQSRFHRNIHDDAERLATESDALVSYFDVSDDSAGTPLSPLEEVEGLLSRLGWQHAAHDQEHGHLAQAAQLRKPAKVLFDAWTDICNADALALPLAEIEAHIAALGYDTPAIAAATQTDWAQVMRRLAVLPEGEDRPPLGLVICDAGGFPTLVKEVPGFAFPRGAACPLWPVYTALGQPGRPIVSDVEVPGQPNTRLRCWAIAEQVGVAQINQPPMLRATMLVLPDPAPGPLPPVPLGVSCRICPRMGCAARREPSVLGGEIDEQL